MTQAFTTAHHRAFPAAMSDRGQRPANDSKSADVAIAASSAAEILSGGGILFVVGLLLLVAILIPVGGGAPF